MFIEDKELRDLFKVESEEQLQRLDRGLLELERDPGNQAILEELFRNMHSLKGGARMLFLPDVEAISHRLESVLAAARKGRLRLTSETMDPLYRCLDALRRLAHEAITGEPAGVSAAEVMARLPGTEDRGGSEELEPTAEPQPEASALPGPGALVNQRTPEATLPELMKAASPFRIETIRVATEKLDALMTLVGELSVTKNRLAHRLLMIDEIIGAWDNVHRVGAVSRARLNDDGGGSGNGWEKKLTDHYTRENELVEHLGVLLNDVRTAAYEDDAKLDVIVTELEDGVRSVRLLPLSTVFSLFPRMVRDLARSQAKEARLQVKGEETTADKRIIEEIKDPLMHLIRNAIDHGIEPPDERERNGKPRGATIELKASKTAGNIFIELKDDGQGLDMDAIKRTALKRRFCSAAELEVMAPAEIRSLIFLSGFSTSTFVSDVSGRGVGLDVVRTNVERLKGIIHVESADRVGCTFKVRLPITMATARVLIVGVGTRKYAILVEHVESIHLVPRRAIFTLEGRMTMALDDRPVSLARLADLLELPESGPSRSRSESKAEVATPAMPCVVVTNGEDRVGLLVDDLLDEQEIVLKPHSKLLKRVRNVSGATILGTGEVCVVLNHQDLLKSARKREGPAHAPAVKEEAERTRLILMAEDSLTTRTQMKRILEGAGYEVVAAVDGLDAWNKIGTRAFDGLVTDVMMPNMDGLTLTRKLRDNPKYKELPIILVTTLSSDEDRKRGLEVGASAYITKPAFDQKALLDTLRRLT